MSGLGIPCGGMLPARNRRSTFFHYSAFAVTCAMSARSSVNPAVFKRWLWQVTQYLLRRSRLAPRAETASASSGAANTTVAQVTPAISNPLTRRRGRAAEARTAPAKTTTKVYAILDTATFQYLSKNVCAMRYLPARSRSRQERRAALSTLGKSRRGNSGLSIFSDAKICSQICSQID